MYLYLDFSIYYEERGLDGFANRYMIQAADDMIKKMKLSGNDSKGLYSLYAEFAARVYSAPSLVL